MRAREHDDRQRSDEHSEQRDEVPEPGPDSERDGARDVEEPSNREDDDAGDDREPEHPERVARRLAVRAEREPAPVVAALRVGDLRERGREPPPAVGEEEEREDERGEQSRAPVGGRPDRLRRCPAAEHVGNRLHELPGALRELELLQRLAEPAPLFQLVGPLGQVALQPGRLGGHVVDEPVGGDAARTADGEEHHDHREGARHPTLHDLHQRVEDDGQGGCEDDPADHPLRRPKRA